MQGCYGKLNELIDKYQYWAIVIGAVIIVIEVKNRFRDAMVNSIS